MLGTEFGLKFEEGADTYPLDTIGLGFIIICGLGYFSAIGVDADISPGEIKIGVNSLPVFRDDIKFCRNKIVLFSKSK